MCFSPDRQPTTLKANFRGLLSWASPLKDVATQKTLGTILGVDDTTVNTLFEVDTNAAQPLLLPASYDLIASVDAQKHEITMHIPDGILELD